MNFGSIGEGLIFVIAIAGFLMLFSLMRSKDPKKARTEIVRTLMSELKVNTILVETFDRQPKPRRFEVTGWHMNKKKINFLEKDLQKDLADVFGRAVDYNERLKGARKLTRKGEPSQKVTLDTADMLQVLPRVKAGLEDWLLANVGSIDNQERPGMLDGLFGGR